MKVAFLANIGVMTKAFAGVKNVLRYTVKGYRFVTGNLGGVFLWPAINAFAFCIYNFPIVGKRLLQGWCWDNKGAIILCYHEIDSQAFERHVRWLKKHWKIISIDTLVERIGRKQDMENSVVITFDDGWKSNYTEVLPIIKKYNIPITIYLVSDTAGTEKEFWMRAISTSQQVMAHSLDYEATPNKRKHAEICQMMEHFQYYAQRRGFLSLTEIREMLDSKLVTFGSHSKSHPCLNMMEPEKVEEEITSSKGDLESKLRVNITHFSYPFGSYDESHIDILKKGGYASAVTGIPRLNSIQTDPYQLGRMEVVSRTGKYGLTMMISGLWHRLGFGAGGGIVPRLENTRLK